MSEAIANHREELLARFPDRKPEEWVTAALESAERDFKLANNLLEIHGLHPLTWTPPLVAIAREQMIEVMNHNVRLRNALRDALAFIDPDYAADSAEWEALL